MPRHASGTIRHHKVSSFYRIYEIRAPKVTAADGKTQLPIRFNSGANLVETRSRPTKTINNQNINKRKENQ
jgi:hypothetical protein